jgi:hypothetical protein
MARLKGRQITVLEQVVLVVLAISLQLLLYFIPPSLPYPFYIKNPDLGGLFLLFYTISFLGGITSGVALGWRYLPVTVLCMAATTLALWALMAGLMLIFSAVAIDDVIKDIVKFFNIMVQEETMPAAAWAMMGGMVGSFPNMLGKRIGTTESPFRFLSYMTVASIVIIVIIGIAAVILRGGVLILAWGPMVFMGITLGLLAPGRAVFLAGISQALAVVSWMSLTIHGEAVMLIVPLLLMIPIFAGCGILGAKYGTYLSNRFFSEENNNTRTEGRFSGGKKR